MEKKFKNERYSKEKVLNSTIIELKKLKNSMRNNLNDLKKYYI